MNILDRVLLKKSSPLERGDPMDIGAGCVVNFRERNFYWTHFI